MAHDAGLLSVSGIDAGTTGDTAVPVPFSRYLVRAVTACGASANLAATTATLSLRTAAAGAGTAIVALQPLTSLASASVAADLTLAVTATAQTAGTLFLRIVQGLTPVAGTINVVIEITPLP